MCFSLNPKSTSVYVEKALVQYHQFLPKFFQRFILNTERARVRQTAFHSDKLRNVDRALVSPSIGETSKLLWNLKNLKLHVEYRNCSSIRPKENFYIRTCLKVKKYLHNYANILFDSYLSDVLSLTYGWEFECSCTIRLHLHAILISVWKFLPFSIFINVA